MSRARAEAQVEEFVRYMVRHKGRSRKTIYSYRLHYVELLDMVAGSEGGEASWTDVTLADLRAYVTRPIEYGVRGRGQEPMDGTKKVRASALRSLFGYLHGEGYLRSNPALKLETPDVDNEKPKPISVEAWRAIWASDMDEVDRAGLGLGLFCGLRREEITQLKSGHFAIVDGDPQLAGFPRKGGTAKWPVPWLDCARLFELHMPQMIGGDARSFTEPLLRLVRDSRDRPHLMAPWKDRMRSTGRKPKYKTPEGFIPPKKVWQRLRAVCAAAGVTEQVTPHMLRHGFGTYMLRNMNVPLIDVSRMMGHTDVRITQAYIDSAANPLRALVSTGGPQVDLDQYGPWA